MRIIAGEWKGLNLQRPTGMDIRPTTDRVKESMFNLLGPYFQADLVVDLFSGSGALGLEALSRGARRCVFVDSHRASIEVLRKNIGLCQAKERADVIQADWRRGLTQIAANRQPVDVLFLDPPYGNQLWEPVLELVDELALNVRRVVCEHPSQTQLSDKLGSCQLLKRRSYGDITVSIYEMEGRGAGDNRDFSGQL